MIKNIEPVNGTVARPRREPASEIKNLCTVTKVVLAGEKTLERYVLGKKPNLLTEWKKNRGIKLILAGRKFPKAISRSPVLHELLYKFANLCAELGIDFRTLNIPQIFEYAPSLDKSDELYEHLVDYANNYHELLAEHGVPIHNATTNYKWMRPFLYLLNLFYRENGNEAFRSAVIGAKDAFITQTLSTIDLKNLMALAPERVLENCTYDEIIELDAIAKSRQVSLMYYYKNYSVFDTQKPEVFISRLRGLFLTTTLKNKVNKIREHMSHMADSVVNYAKAAAPYFADLFARAVVKISEVPVRVPQKKEEKEELKEPFNPFALPEEKKEPIPMVAEDTEEPVSEAEVSERADEILHDPEKKRQFAAKLQELEDRKYPLEPVISIIDDIKNQVERGVLAAGVGEIHIAVNHLDAKFDTAYVERVLGKEKFSMYKETLADEFAMIKDTLAMIQAKYTHFRVVVHFEMVTTTMAKINDALPNAIREALLVPRGNRQEDLEQHVTFTFPRTGMKEIKTPEMITGFFEGFQHAYERWSDSCHDRSDLALIGVSHINLSFMPMPSGGCLEGQVIEKIGKCVWVPKTTPKDPVCFWNCLAAGLHPENKKMRKAGNAKSAELNELTNQLIAQYYRHTGQESIRTMVSLSDVPAVAKALEINIVVYTLVEGARQELIKYDAGHVNTIKLHLHLVNNQPGHYCLINELTGYGEPQLSCERCGKVFYTRNTESNHSGPDRYHKHVKKCKAISRGEIVECFKEKPIRGTKSMGDKYLGKDIRKEIAIYFDFESTLEPCAPSDEKASLRELNRQEANGFVIKVYDHKNKKVLNEYTKRVLSANAAKELADVFDQMEESIVAVLQSRWETIAPTVQAILEASDLPVMAIDFVMRAIEREFITVPVYAYNGGHYDYNLLIKHLRKNPIVHILSKTSDFISFDYGYYRFLDSRNYVPAGYSLQAFANAFGQGVHLEKDIFPYRYVSSFEKLADRAWPAFEWFESDKVSQKDYDERKVQFESKCVADTHYNLGEYMMDYCEKDVDLLIAGMDGFAETCFSAEGMDALKFCTIGQIAWRIFLCNYREAVIKTIPDKDSYDIINGSTFGGNCQMFKPHMKVGAGEIGFELDMTNMYGKAMRMALPYAVRDYAAGASGDQKRLQDIKECKQWMRDGDKGFVERYIFGRMNAKDLKNCGFIRCNLLFTKEQQDRVHVFPPIPIRRVIDEKELSELSLNEMQDLLVQDKAVMRFEKMVYDLQPKVRYDIYTPALKFLLVNNLVTLGKTHDYLPCHTEYVMTDFIVAMTERRILAQKMINEGKEKNDSLMKRKGETLKDFYKLINNSGYGKTCQDDTKYHKTVISTSAASNAKYLTNYIVENPKIITQPDSKTYGQDDEGMSMYSAINPHVKIKAPKHLGAGVLWNSKMVMLDFLYNCLLVHCSETEIYYTDTDSVHVKMLMKQASAEYVEEIRKKFGCDAKSAAAIASLYSRFPPEVRAKYLPADKDDIIAGKMKVDQIFFQGAEGIYLKAKTYIECNPTDEGKMKIVKVRDKGCSLKQNSDALRLDNYRSSLYEHTAIKGTNMMIRKIQGPGEMYMASVVQRKWILDPFNDKRYKIVENNEIVTYPYGYYKLDATKHNHLIYNVSMRAQTFMSNHKELKPYLHKLKEVRAMIGTNGEGMKAHLEAQFTEGMCWNNYGLLHQGWNIDHTVPVSKLKKAIRADGTVDEDSLDTILREVCHYTNMAPMWKRENSAKGGI